MPITITYTNDAFPEGTEFDIKGIGVVVSGTPVELSLEQERLYLQEQGEILADIIADENFTIEGNSLLETPTLVLDMPTGVAPGGTVTGYVSINQLAPEGGTIVSLTASDDLTVPATVTIAEGDVSASFSVEAAE